MWMWWLACTGAPEPLDPDEAPPFAEGLATYAADRLGPTRYADPTASAHASPSGVVADGDGQLWAWSDAAPTQWRLDLETQAVAETRAGPLRTRRCVAAESETWCVGEQERGGLWSSAGHASPLPAHGGYRDLVVTGDHLHVVDSVSPALRTVSAQGELLHTTPTAPAPLRAGPVGDTGLWLATGTAPHLWLWSLDATGRPTSAHPLPTTVPVRDAVYDPARDTLWTVGPLDRTVRRNTGPVRGLGTVVLGWANVRTTPATEPIRWPLPDIVDGTRLVLHDGGLAISCTGSDEVVQLDPDTGALTRRAPVGPAPQGLTVLPQGGLAVASRLDDAVFIVASDDRVRRITVDDTARDTPIDLGERLFYSAILWPDAAPGFSCNSCHWDQGVDHRQQPGLREVRYEQTRPIAGMSAVHPVFTPGQGKQLDVVADGFVRLLDPRYWTPRTDRWWLQPRTFTGKGGAAHTLGALELRQVLVAFLASRPVEPGPLRGHPIRAEAVAAGQALFLRDCAGCHRPTRSMYDPQRLPDDTVTDALSTGPVVFAAPLWARTGVTPQFTPRGHRIAPLWELGRGGPFLSNGSAPDLRAVLARCRPGTSSVHGGAGDPVYDEGQQAVLEAFLLSL